MAAKEDRNKGDKELETDDVSPALEAKEQKVACPKSPTKIHEWDEEVNGLICKYCGYDPLKD